MGGPTGSIRVPRVVATEQGVGGRGTPDYSDAFAVRTEITDTRTPEEWSRAVFEDAPRPVRWFLLVGWRAALGFRLGPRPSPDHVLGWWIVTATPGAIRLELRSALMTGHLVLRLDHPHAVITTVVLYRHRAARALWATVAPIHRQVVPYLLRHAALRSSTDEN
jgi:Protein of unknown function (DUF2867)